MHVSPTVITNNVKVILFQIQKKYNSVVETLFAIGINSLSTQPQLNQSTTTSQ